MVLVLFHFTLPTFLVWMLKAGEPCQSKRSSNDTDKGWRSRRWQMWKRSVMAAATEGTGTDLSGFDGSLKHCSEPGAVISLTIPPFSLLCCNEPCFRGRLVAKHLPVYGKKILHACYVIDLRPFERRRDKQDSSSPNWTPSTRPVRKKDELCTKHATYII